MTARDGGAGLGAVGGELSGITICAFSLKFNCLEENVIAEC